MLNSLRVMAITLVCAGIGVVLAVRPLTVNAEATDLQSILIVTASPISDHERKGVSLKGIRQTVSLRKTYQSSKEIQSLWQQFTQFKKLENAVVWGKPIDLYAYYTDFNNDFSKATLSIGYDIKQLNASEPVAALLEDAQGLNAFEIESGKYQQYAVTGTSSAAVSKAWLSLPLTEKTKAVLEHYQLDVQGQVSKVELEVKNVGGESKR
mgnify:CR=1 FL=1